MPTTDKRVYFFSLIFAFLTLDNVVRAQIYYVQPGDSLYSIAARYGTSVTVLQQDNGLTTTEINSGQALRISRQVSTETVSSNNTVRSGDSLYITYIVKYGDPLYLIAKRYGISLKTLLAANNLKNVSSIRPGQKLLIPRTTSDSVNSGDNSKDNFNLSQSDIDLLARLVSAEASGEPFPGQVAVAATILNRLEDSRYPNTISGIIYQVDNGSYQYSPVLDGRINLPASASAYQAVEQAVSGSDPSNGANGFYNPDKTTNEWVRSQTVTAAIGDHVFYRY